MQLLLIGPSGSGKDTQAALISRDYNLKWVSIGELCRQRALITDDEGKFIAETINNGHLLPWEHLFPILKKELDSCYTNFIWTGFPRVLDQAQHLDNLLKEYNSRVDFVINLNLDEQRTKERIEYRKSTGINIREDDLRDDLIQNRMNYYNTSIGDIRNYYSDTGRLVDVDASGSISEVYEHIKMSLIPHIKADE